MFGDEHIDHTAFAQSGAARDPIDIRPLEEITGLADNLSRMNGGLASYLERFNGPRPSEIGNAKAEAPVPSCYRSEINRLRREIELTGSLTDQISKLG